MVCITLIICETELHCVAEFWYCIIALLRTLNLRIPVLYGPPG